MTVKYLSGSAIKNSRTVFGYVFTAPFSAEFPMLVLSAGRAATGCELLVVAFVADGGLMLQAVIKRRSEISVSIRTGMVLMSPLESFFLDILKGEDFGRRLMFPLRGSAVYFGQLF